MEGELDNREVPPNKPHTPSAFFLFLWWLKGNLTIRNAPKENLYTIRVKHHLGAKGAIVFYNFFKPRPNSEILNSKKPEINCPFCPQIHFFISGIRLLAGGITFCQSPPDYPLLPPSETLGIISKKLRVNFSWCWHHPVIIC